MILGQGLALVTVGVLSGLGIAALLSSVTGRVLLLVSGTDPLTFGVVTILLAAIAMWACWIPARRAMKVDPMVALRYE